ncbi:MAG: ATP-binding cassette domain-containing protein [Candidatus Actinomarina sp.]
MSEIFFKSTNLTLGYSNQVVLNNLNLEFSEKNNYQIIGRNGAGKSTLINYISSNFDGSDFKSKVIRTKSNIDQISPYATLIMELTLLENIKYFTTKSHLSTDDKLKVSNNYLPEIYLNEKVENFSSGMIKRAELSIIEIKNPTVLCIDEPLNFLDSKGINLLKNLIDNRTQNQKSNILSTQELIDFQGINFEIIDLNEHE